MTLLELAKKYVANEFDDDDDFWDAIDDYSAGDAAELIRLRWEMGEWGIPKEDIIHDIKLWIHDTESMLECNPQIDIVRDNPYEQVRQFHEIFGHPINETPTVPDDSLRDLRIELIREELEEFVEAMTGCGAKVKITWDLIDKEPEVDLVAAADALADLIYVVCGAAHVMGINLQAVVNEVHRSNMSKLGEDGKPIYREDGKILKGEAYEPPDVAKVLDTIVNTPWRRLTV